MTPEYLEQLADRADPQKLWQRSGIEQMAMPEDMKAQLNTGVALRRYAALLREFRGVLDLKKSLLITPLGPVSTAKKVVDSPRRHAEMRGDFRGPPRD